MGSAASICASKLAKMSSKSDKDEQSSNLQSSSETSLNLQDIQPVVSLENVHKECNGKNQSSSVTSINLSNTGMPSNTIDKALIIENIQSIDTITFSDCDSPLQLDNDTAVDQSFTRSGLKSPPAVSKTSDFRKRRLSVTSKRSSWRAAPVQSRPSSSLFRSQEIGAYFDASLPFPESLVGSYSCHGIEPSLNGNDGIAAKINQDRGCIIYPFGENKKQAIFAVFDGHGEHGDTISHFAMNAICTEFEEHLHDDPVTALKQSFVSIDRSLLKSHSAEAVYSGTTAVCVYMRKNVIWVSNVGDSRVVLAQSSSKINGTYTAKDLSIDQNPNSPIEQQRIEALGGFVSPPPEPGLSARVWLDREMTQIGLAMARSIGDHAVKNIGVISEPVVMQYNLGPDDAFIILASDGVWEFVSSQEAVDKVANNLDKGCMKATQALIEAAAEKWCEIEGDYRDDITAIVIRLPCFLDDKT